MSVSSLVKKYFNPNDYEPNQDMFLQHGDKYTVVAAQHSQTNETYAFKLYGCDDFTLQDQKYFIREACAYAAIDHPAGVSFYGFSLPSSENTVPVFLLEFCKNGSLREAIDNRPTWFNSTAKMITIAGLVSIIAHFHSNGFVHRSLKPEYILYDSDYHPKLCNYGSARCSLDESNSSPTIPSATRYQAPDSRENSADPSYDVFSVGSIIFEIVTGQYAFEGFSNRQLAEGERPFIPASVPTGLVQIIQRCWSNNPKDRPTMHEVLELLGNDNCLLDNVQLPIYQTYYKTVLNHTDPSMSKTTRRLRLKCKDGDPVDWYNYAMSLLKDNPTNSRSRSIAQEYLLKASHDFYLASYQLGLLALEDPSTRSQAITYFNKGVSKKHPESLRQYAICLRDGIGISPQPEEALNIFKTSAQLGNLEAYVDYATLLISHSDNSTDKRKGKGILAALYQSTKDERFSRILEQYEDDE